MYWAIKFSKCKSDKQNTALAYPAGLASLLISCKASLLNGIQSTACQHLQYMLSGVSGGVPSPSGCVSGENGKGGVRAIELRTCI